MRSHPAQRWTRSSASGTTYLSSANFKVLTRPPFLISRQGVIRGRSTLHLREVLEQPGSDAQNAVRWAGTVDVRRGIRARGLRADLSGFDLGLLRALRPGLDVHGRVTGTIDADGDLAQGIALQAEFVSSRSVDHAVFS